MQGDISYQTITSIAESPFTFGELYVGTDDGLLHRSLDSGKNWERIDAALAQERWMSRVVASRHHEGVVYVTQNGKRWDDAEAYVWRSPDQGDTWVDISRGIPASPVNVILEDPHVPGLLYVGTDMGVYVSQDDGASWNILGGNLPSTFVHDLALHEREDVLLAATHGRGVWLLDVRRLQGREAAPEEGGAGEEPEAEEEPEEWEEDEGEEEEDGLF